MRYNDTLEKSAEFLRQAIPLMSRQRTALHPISFAVWYEYVSGMNEPLSKKIDELLATTGSLDEQMTAALYQTYIVGLSEQVVQSMTDGFQRVLNEISSSANNVSTQASHFGNALEQWTQDILNELPGQKIDTSAILTDTRKMQNAAGSLKEQLVKSQSEIERLREEVNQARADALIDVLTGLANRRGFNYALQMALAEEQKTHTQTSLLMIDIDHFKRLNDTYGHLFGDKVIRTVAQVLRSNVKGRDTAARYGGEEFTVLLPETSIDGAKALAERIRTTIANGRIRRNEQEELQEAVTVSVGVACHCEGESPDLLIGRADEALYRAKSAGRNQVQLAA